MRLHNSATKAVERFRPRPDQPVALYVCGITPYDTTHLGHAFTYVVFDVLVRHMQVVHGWPVTHVQNVTDIDDDILAAAARAGRDWRDFGTQWTQRFMDDMASLNVRPPSRFPGATAYIPEIQEAVQALLDAGHAYVSGGSVYFRVASDPSFGSLYGCSREDMLATANRRGNVPDDPHKEDPLDFVLWQAGQPGEPAWRSPWGAGRPGWHIECSAMSRALLGQNIDVHGGGTDLLFPHHACGIAQSEPLIDTRPWVRCWMHTAMVRKDGRKMAKSTGNLVLVRDLLAAAHPDTLRLYLLLNHYRTPWEWQREAFEGTASWSRTLHAAVARESGTGVSLDPGSYGPRFTNALDNDLDTPAAVDIVMELADDILAAPQNACIAAARDVLQKLAGDVLGLWLRPLDQVPDSLQAMCRWPAPEIAPPHGVSPLKKGRIGASVVHCRHRA